MIIHFAQPFSFSQLGGRDSQQDARFPDFDVPKNTPPFFIICDGVGGEVQGGLASKTVCMSLAKSLASFDLSHEFTHTDFSHCLYDAYMALENQQSGENYNMATTLALVVFHSGGCMAAHIGDSRIYQIRPGQGILYRSEDHSLVNILVHNGALSPEEAINHPDGNVITRSLTPNTNNNQRDKATVFQISDIADGDYFVLCTDGVLQVISDGYLTSLLCEEDMTDEEKYKRLKEQCHESSDNNTLFLIHVDQVFDNSDEEESIQSDDFPTTLPLKQIVNTVKEVDAVASIGFWEKLRKMIRLA